VYDILYFCGWRVFQVACDANPDDPEALRAVDLLFETALISSGFTVSAFTSTFVNQKVTLLARKPRFLQTHECNTFNHVPVQNLVLLVVGLQTAALTGTRTK
jgi:hypothetical protein